MNTKYATLKTLLAAAVLSAVALSGCGGGSTTGNVTVVSISPKGATTAPLSVIVTQSLTLTATVTGNTNTNVTWGCTYATLTFDSSGKQQTGTATACTSETGNIPANSANSTVIFTAPQSVPDPRKILGNNCTSAQLTCILEVTITATSVADTKKTDTSVITVDSGISVTLSPTTATVPTSASFQFSATVTNDIGTTTGVTWLISQGTIDLTKGINYPQLTTCDPGCGHIANAGDTGNPTPGFYTAPATVPSTATVTLVATSKADPTRFAIGTITITKAGDITFNGISPLVMPQGAATYDLYVFAPGVTSASTITLSSPTGSIPPFIPNDPRLKILFPIPTTANTTPTSTGVRIRLDASVLSSSGTWTVDVSDPNHPPTKGPGPFKFNVVPVRASSFTSVPDSFVQNSATLSSFLVNGGYFGTNGSLVQALFLGDTKAAIAATSRQLDLQFDSSKANAAQPGLYPLSVVRDSTPLPSPNNGSVTNFTLFPDYSGTPSAPFAEGVSLSKGVDGATLTQPSAIDIDQELGIAAVATTGSNRVDFFQIGGSGNAGTLKAIGLSATVNAPTSVSIDHTLHQVAVVSFQDQTVSLFQLPQPNTSSTTAIQPIDTISMQGLIQASAGTSSNPFVPAFPYSIGVDSDTHHALVAYSSSSNPTTARVGFLLDLNTGDTGCLQIGTTPPAASPCVSAQVTLTTGQYPQIAMLPHAHMAVVTPGGLGSTAGINVLQTSSAVPIKNVSLTSGLVTVVTTADHGINPVTPGTVLIENVPAGITNQVDFNGAFPVLSVINSTTFTYALAQTVNDTAVGINCTDPKATNCTPTPSLVFFGTPNISIGGLSQTTQGIAVNQLTGLVAAADANATGQNGPQINMLNSLDQTFSSITFRTTGTGGCTFYTSPCTGGPELLGTTSVAFQPFANLLVSYNGPRNELSVSNPATQQRYAWQPLNPRPASVQASQSSITVHVNVTGATPPTVSVALALNGGLAVDAASNQAVVVNSGTGTVELVALGPVNPTVIKPVHVTEVLGGIPGANFPQGTLTSTTDLGCVKIFGSGFTASSQVRLDGASINGTTTTGSCPGVVGSIPTVKFVSDRELDVNIPASFLGLPHHYALDVVDAAGTSNVSDFFVVGAVDLTAACQNSKPTSVAIADQLVTGAFEPIAIVTNSGCNNVAIFDIAPQLPTFDSTSGAFTGFASNPNYGKVPTTIGTGSSPSGIAVSPRFGLAGVANNGAGTASILDIVGKKSFVPDVTTGSGPIGVAINEGTGAALVANTSQNTVSEINLGLLFPPPTTPATTPPTTLTATSIGVDTAPIAIAIDPDRGTNNNGLAVVTALALSSSFPRGVLDAVDIGSATPAKSTSVAPGTITLTPTGIVFDPSVSPTLFYAVSSSGNLVAAFNPDTGSSPSVRVGVNPTSLALNPQTGQILTVNTLTNTISIIDSLSFKTRRSYGLPGPPPAGVTLSSLQTNQVAIDQFLNMAVIVDQAHNRVLLFPMPN